MRSVLGYWTDVASKSVIMNVAGGMLLIVREWRAVCVAGLVVLVLNGGCGGRELGQESADETESAAPTASLVPTATATPLPYGLTVRVTDVSGNPIPWADITLRDVAVVPMRSEEGVFLFGDLPERTVSLMVAAQGFYPDLAGAKLEPGTNELTVTLERDRFGLHPGEACAPDELLLYLEDFQDEAASGWSEVEAGLPGWAIGPDDDDDVVLKADVDAKAASLSDYVFGDAVWRLQFRVTGGGTAAAFTWRSSASEGAAYVVDLGGEVADGPSLLREELGKLEVVAKGDDTPEADAWHLLEIATFDGVTTVWMDGVEYVGPYEDPAPWPEGSLGLEPRVEAEDGLVMVDDIAVCGLAVPFETLYAEEPTG
jgi:hypothetical protein